MKNFIKTTHPGKFEHVNSCKESYSQDLINSKINSITAINLGSDVAKKDESFVSLKDIKESIGQMAINSLIISDLESILNNGIPNPTKEMESKDR